MKTYWYSCFAMIVIADAFITQYMLRFPNVFAEANPIMRAAIEHSSLGIFTPKLIALAGILACWKLCSPALLAVLSCSMAAVLLHNCFALYMF